MDKLEELCKTKSCYASNCKEPVALVLDKPTAIVFFCKKHGSKLKKEVNVEEYGCNQALLDSFVYEA